MPHITPKNPAFDFNKYQPFAFAPKLENRTWPDKTITKAPIWASVDLRDGNQALIDPMTIEQKLKFFKLLVEIGFKEIEIGFPSAAQVEFDFTRRLIEEGLVPDEVTLQVWVQAREPMVRPRCVIKQSIIQTRSGCLNIRQKASAKPKPIMPLRCVMRSVRFGGLTLGKK